MVPRFGSMLLLRHGESTANAAGLFTGVLDVGLTERGFREARTAAKLITAAGVRPDVTYVSELRRTRQTAEILLRVLDLPSTPIRSDWRLDERNYGALTGRSKHDVRAEFGEVAFRMWRRSVDVAPPPMPDDQFDSIAGSVPFRNLPAVALSRTESLADVIARVRSFYLQRIVPDITGGLTVLVVGHGNSLRALCADLDQLSRAEIEALNIPTGQPLLYDFGRIFTLEARSNHYLDPDTALPAAIGIAQQGGT